MIKVEVIEEFTLGEFKEIKNLVRYNSNKNEYGRLYLKDTFECDKNMADYLTKSNKLNRPFVKVIEVISQETAKKTAIRKTTKKQTSVE
jgi:hypothetical protein